MPERPYVQLAVRLELVPLRIFWMHVLFLLVIFAFFVKNDLLGNTKLSFLVLLLKSYRPCRQRALYFSLFLDSLLKITY